jgi:hypothetical protein
MEMCEEKKQTSSMRDEANRDEKIPDEMRPRAQVG